MTSKRNTPAATRLSQVAQISRQGELHNVSMLQRKRQKRRFMKAYDLTVTFSPLSVSLMGRYCALDLCSIALTFSIPLFRAAKGPRVADCICIGTQFLLHQ